MGRFRTYSPEQLLLLPPNMKDWLKEGHLAWFISDTVDALDLEEFIAPYKQHKDERGNPAYHPTMMLKILLYGYCIGVVSSRKLEKACWTDVAFRVLSVNQYPDHDSIAEFRRRNLGALSRLFKQVLKMAQKAGLVKMGVVALDGTKIKANASKHKAMSYERMLETEKRLEKEVEQLLTQANAVDEEEDRLYGRGKRGDELPAELSRRESRLEAIRRAKAAVEEETRQMAQEQQRRKQKEQNRDKKVKPPKAGFKKKNKQIVPNGKAQYNFTDPGSRIMWSTNTKSYEQAYNAQAAVDKESQIIIATAVTQEANDKRQLLPMVKNIRRQVAEDPQRLLADSGYCSEENLTDKSLDMIELFIPPNREKHGSKPQAPRGRIPKNLSAVEKMKRKLRTVKGKSIYALRKSIVEPVFGQIKHCRNFRQFSMRGIDKVSKEWDLVCLTHNLRKIFNSGWQPSPA